jgi:hypothetical protein
MELIFIIPLGILLILISRGGSAAFGKGVGTMMAIAFLGFIALFGGATIIMFLLPFLTAVFIPLALAFGAVAILLWVVRAFKRAF